MKTVTYLARIPNSEAQTVLPHVRAAVQKFANGRMMNVVRDENVGVTYVYTRDDLGPYPVNTRQARKIQQSLNLRLGMEPTRKVFNSQLLAA